MTNRRHGFLQVEFDQWCMMLLLFRKITRVFSKFQISHVILLLLFKEALCFNREEISISSPVLSSINFYAFQIENFFAKFILGELSTNCVIRNRVPRTRPSSALV